jgi:hypothetical protein
MAVTGLDSGAATGARNEAAPDVDAAIARVLAAERDARAAVSDCAARVEAHVQGAREQARTIAARAAQRSARVHAAVEQRIADAVARLEAERASLGSGPEDGARLAAAVAALARDLTAPEPPGDARPQRKDAA